MQDQLIIYPTENGGVAVLVPAPDCGLPIEAIALKDVPHGVPYKIISRADMPTDQTFRDAWEYDAPVPDGQGADYGVGSTKDVIGWTEDKQPILKGQP